MRFLATRHVLGVSMGLVFLPLSQNGGGQLLLGRVSENYDSMANYVLEGSETVVLANTDCRIEFPFEITHYKTGELTPPPTIRFQSPNVVPQYCRDEIAKEGGLKQPGIWADLSTIDTGVETIRELPNQVLHTQQGDNPCVVLEVNYDQFSQKVRNIVGPIRYWIEPASKLIRRLEFNDLTVQGIVRPWSVTITKVSVGGSSSPNPEQDALAPPAAMGKLAPDIGGQTAQGKTIRLLDLRGKVVLLDFWATWCTACLEEMPVFEKLRADEAFSDVVILGVSDEKSDVVNRWLQQYGRSYQTLVDAKHVFSAFGIGPIPARIIINRQGIATRYFLGFDSEHRIRRALKDALAETSEGAPINK